MAQVLGLGESDAGVDLGWMSGDIALEEMVLDGVVRTTDGSPRIENIGSGARHNGLNIA